MERDDDYGGHAEGEGEAAAAQPGLQKQVDWQRVFFDSSAAWTTRLASVSRRRFPGTPDAEAAYNHALDRMSADDWLLLRKSYRGTGRPENFMAVTFIHLLEDYAVRKYGRKRPPAWVARLNGLWLDVYQLLCLRRMPRESIVEQLSARGTWGASAIRDAIGQILARVKGCGEHVGEYADSDTGARMLDQANPTPITALEMSDCQALLGLLSDMLKGSGNASKNNSERINALSRRLMEDAGGMAGTLTISDHERLMLRLIYQEGYSITAAARTMGVNRKKMSRDLAKAVGRLRRGLKRLGYDSRTIQQAER